MLATPAAWANQPPVVDLLAAEPSAVRPGETATILIEAHDPDCPGVCLDGCGQYIRSDLTSWTVSSGVLLSTDNGAPGSPYSASAVWQAPDSEGSATVSVTLADSGGMLCGGRASTTAELVVQVSSVAGSPPVIESLTAEPATVLPDQPCQLECQAVDPDGGPIAYGWSSDDGLVTPGGDGTAVLTSASPGAVTVVCTATDESGLSATAAVAVAVTAALAERSLAPGLLAPQRAAVTSWGDVYVADQRSGGITAVNLFTGALVYRLPIAGITGVDVDWQDRLVVARRGGAEVRTRSGDILLSLASPGSAGPAADVAVDPVNHRYGVLRRASGRVELFDEGGGLIAAFGSTGDAPEQLKSPGGIAFTPSGGIVVADTGHGQVKLFDPSGALLGAMGGLGGGAGEFVQLVDVAVDHEGRIYACDSYQDWVHVFSPDGALLDTLGTYGDGVGQLDTAAGVAAADAFDRLLVVSLNGSSLEVFRSSDVAPGGGPEPIPSVAPLSLTFDPIPVGAIGSAQGVVLANVGSAPLGILRVRLDGGFVSTDDCGLYLDPGQSCTFQVRFSPDRVGTVTGALAVETSAVGATTIVALAGVALAPARLDLAPPGIDFGVQALGTESEPRRVVLSNSGGQPLQIAAIRVSDDFRAFSSCSGTLAPSASCPIDVVFRPEGAAGPVVGTLTILSSAAGSPHLVGLTGTAVEAEILVSIEDPEPIGEGAGPAVLTVDLSAPGASPITVSWATEDGTAVGGEDFVSSTGSVVVPVGAQTAEVTIDLVDDDLLEPAEESFWVRLTGVDGGALGDDLAKAVIRDDELCPSPNLLAHPDADEPARGDAVPGWTVVEGEAWRVVGQDPDLGGGEVSFAAPSEPGGELAQVVDVSSWQAQIDGGTQELAFEVDLRTEQGGRAQVMVEYLEDDGATVLDRFDSGEIVTEGAWQRVIDVREAPPRTRRVRVRLLAFAEEDEPTVFFDHPTLVSVRTQTAWVDWLAVVEGDVGWVEADVTARLGCRQARELRLVLSTRDGTATAGEDYLAGSATVVIDPGEVEGRLPVTILGDTLDEGHEDFLVDLEVNPGDAVAFPITGGGLILDDDRCPRSAAAWADNLQLWPVRSLSLGAEEYDVDELVELLKTDGSELASEVARELAAAKLNLAHGSSQTIQGLVRSADRYLALHPPGSQPTGDAIETGRDLRDQLATYNGVRCRRPRRAGRG